MEQFITSLYSLAEHCEYGEMKDETIRDHIVVGIRDRPISEQLQLDAELTLEKAKKRVRQCEAIQEQQVTLNEGGKSHGDLLVDSVGSRKGKDKKRRHEISHLKERLRMIQNVPAVAENHMQEIHVQLKRLSVTLAKSQDIIAPNASRNFLLQISTLMHPMNSLKSTMTHCSWTPLILDRRICGMSQSK